MLHFNPIIAVNGKEFATAIINNGSLESFQIVDKAEEINGRKVAYYQWTTSSKDCQLWSLASSMMGSLARASRRREMARRTTNGMPTFRYRSCDDKAIVLEVGTPEYRAAVKLCKLLPKQFHLYKEGTFMGMEPKEETRRYWLMGF